MATRRLPQSGRSLAGFRNGVDVGVNSYGDAHLGPLVNKMIPYAMIRWCPVLDGDGSPARSLGHSARQSRSHRPCSAVQAGRATAKGGRRGVARDWIGARPHGHSVVEVGTGTAWFRTLSSHARGARAPRERASLDRCIRGPAGLSAFANLRSFNLERPLWRDTYVSSESEPVLQANPSAVGQ
jgi:hypothetical protein